MVKIEIANRIAEGLGSITTRLALILLSFSISGPILFAEEKVDFQRDIRPILSNTCFHCHGPDENHQEAGLRLDTKEGAFGDHHGDPAIVPGDPKRSVAIARIFAEEEAELMPPIDSQKTLKPEEKELLRKWVEQGAEWEEHWSFVAPQKTTPPVTKENWGHNEIDHFVLARLEQKGLKPSPAADRRTLIRRLSLDLTGLPPTSDEVEAFVNDESPNAYEKLVDRLLASPRYAERMTLQWLDLARYADTNGYSIDGGRHMWLWRDWVIDAFHQNKPYNEFIIEQLAGDLLPEATSWQKIATGFNRNHMITHEGGTIPAENLTNYTVDRVKTTGEVFLGLTMGCGQCHNHKYDPISQKDFYRFFAYFNTLEDRGLDGNSGINAGPKLKHRTELKLATSELEQIDQQLSELQQQLAQPDPRQFADWEKKAREHLQIRGENFQLHELEVLKASDPNRGSNFEVLENGRVFVPGPSGRSPSISMKVKGEVKQLSGLRIEFYPNEKFPEKRTGHGKEGSFPGSFILTSLSASATALPSAQVDLYKRLKIKEVTASASHEEYPPEDCLDPRDHNGWSPYPHDTQQQHLTVSFDQPLDVTGSPFITTMLVWGDGKFGYGQRLIAGEYKIFGISGVDTDSYIPAEIQPILELTAEQRTDEQKSHLLKFYSHIAPEFKNTHYQIANLQERKEFLTSEFETMVMNTSAKPRETHILNRGQYDQPLEKVEPGTPGCLPPLPENAGQNRLALANWLVAAEHPLTSRVTVNRLWEVLFGLGIVSTSADFGSQGEPPTHPELLDWLAVDFQEHGWNVKRLLKQIAMSATYQQSSAGTPQLWKEDPQNRLLARGPRFRLQAEMIRDAALKVSGLMNEQIGGPSVNPYQPEGLWREVSHYGSSPATAQVFVQDHADKLYRRSMYTYWKRTVPPPNMQTFDAPNREVCTINRARTNTPLQSLVLLNDVQFVEASRNFAQRIMTEPPADLTQRLQFAFEEALSREPSEKELGMLKAAFEQELKKYQADPQSANRLIEVGESERDQSLAPSELAAWTSIASMIFNTYEFITRG